MTTRLIYVMGDVTAGTAAMKLAARRKLAGVVTVQSPPGFGIPNAPAYDLRPDLAKVTIAEANPRSAGA